MRGNETCREHYPAPGPERLRGLFERGADGLHDPDQNQKRDWRECQDLGDQDARPSVDPARRRNAEPVGEQCGGRCRSVRTAG